MVNTCIAEEDLNRFVNRLHPNLVNNIQSYKQEDSCYLFPKCHGCEYRNRNSTKKSIYYEKGQQCLMPTNNSYWRIAKDKYKDKGRIYLTRQTLRHLKWSKTIFIMAHCNKRRPCIESKKIHLDMFDKDLSRHCWGCRQVFIIIKNFKLQEEHCDRCHNFLEKDTRINPMIRVIFKNNSKYRALSNLYLEYVQKIMDREDAVLDKSGEIDVDTEFSRIEAAASIYFLYFLVRLLFTAIICR